MLKYLWQLFSEGFRESSEARERFSTIALICVAVVTAAAPAVSARVANVLPMRYSWLAPIVAALVVMTYQAFRRDQRQSAELAEFRVAGAASLSDYLDELSASGHSILPPVQQAEAARRLFERCAELARSGNPRARERLPRLADQLLVLSKKTFASSARYVSDYQLVESTLDELGASKALRPKGPA